MIRSITISLSASMLASGCLSQDTIHAQVQHLDAKTFQSELASATNVQLIDVRTLEEYREGHISGALNCNWNDDAFSEQIESLDKRQPVYVYCLSGGRSTQAAEELRNRGFSDVRELSGGILKWRSEGFQVTKAEVPKAEGMTRTDFEKLVSTNGMVLVDFYAEWCAPCRKLKPVLDQIQIDFPNVKVVRVDIDQHPELAHKLKIDALPTIQIYRAGKLDWQHTGVIDQKELTAHLQ